MHSICNPEANLPRRLVTLYPQAPKTLMTSLHMQLLQRAMTVTPASVTVTKVVKSRVRNS